MRGIIYKATCTINGKIYIGQSINSLKKRKSGHKKFMNKKSYTSKFINALRKYGFDKFNWEILESYEKENKKKLIDILNDREYILIESLNSRKEGYNIRRGGRNSPLSEETKEKLRKCNLGKIVSDETREKQSLMRKGIKKSQSHKDKMSISHLGLKPSLESIEKNRTSNRNSKRWICEYCGIKTNGGNYNRWHGEKCKKNG